MMLPAFSLLMGLLLLAALFRLCCRLAANAHLPWGRAFGLSALVSLIYHGQALILRAFILKDAMPGPVLVAAVALITLAASSLLTGWIVRDEAGQSIGAKKGLLVTGLLFLFVGSLAALLYFTAPTPPPT